MPLTRSYKELLERREKEHGKKFDSSELAKQFIPYYENGQRIKVQMHGMSEQLTGTIGVTTGWKPAFLLMRSSRSTGSTWTLSKKDKIIEVMKPRK